MHVARLWVIKPPLQIPCDLVVRDLLKHLVCDCIFTRQRINWLLGVVQSSIGIKMLTLAFETVISDEKFSLVANICFQTLKVITSGLFPY